MVSLVRDVSAYDVIFRRKLIYHQKQMCPILIILLSHDEILAFLLLVIVRNSSLLTDVLICLFRKSTFWLCDFHGLVYLPRVKIKRNGNMCLFAEQIYR